MIEIPKTYAATFAQLSSLFYPAPARTPDTVLSLFAEPHTRESISQTWLNRYAVAELIFLQEYLSTLYNLGTKIDTPAWVIPFIRITPKQLHKAMQDQKTGQKQFRELEKLMRFEPSSKDSQTVLDLFKTAYTPNVRVNAVGKAGYYIIKTLTRTTTAKRRLDDFAEKAIWGAFGPWAAEKLTAEQSLTRGAHSEESAHTQRAYHFITNKLLLSSYSKAEIARFLDVERKSIYNWLESE